MKCYHCEAPTDNGLALCEACRMATSVYLEFLPVYFRNLARWRPGRAGARPVPASREPKSFVTQAADPVSNALDEAGNAITTWARSLHDDRGVDLPDADGEAATVTALCRMFAEHLTSIATLEWAGTFVAEMGELENRLRRLTERVAPGWYAGACKHCQAATHVVPGLTWVKCEGCGATTYARDHLDVILDEARGWMARPMRLAEAVVALVDTEQSVPRLHKRISKWGERGPEAGGIAAFRMVDADGDEVGPKRFRLGDVLDRLLADGSTRLGDTEAKAS